MAPSQPGTSCHARAMCATHTAHTLISLRRWGNSTWGLLLKKAHPTKDGQLSVADPLTQEGDTFRKRFRVPFYIFTGIVDTARVWSPADINPVNNVPCVPLELKVLHTTIHVEWCCSLDRDCGAGGAFCLCRVRRRRGLCGCGVHPQRLMHTYVHSLHYRRCLVYWLSSPGAPASIRLQS
jgi:hypothetical protein